MHKWFTWLLCVLLLLVTPAALAEVFIGEEAPADWQDKNLLRLTVLSTKQSDCMVLEVGEESMFIDGARDSWHDTVADWLLTTGTSHVDYLFSSHPHPDHLDNMVALLKSGALQGELFLLPANALNEQAAQLAIWQLEELGIPCYSMVNGQEMTMGDAVIRMYTYDEGQTVNDRSGMLYITFGHCTMLLTSDIDGAAQNYYVNLLGSEGLHADILKTPHHGLQRMVPRFLDSVSPEFAFITNKAKLSQLQSMQLQKREIPFLYNENGMIILETDGIDWRISQRLDEE